MKSDKAHFQRRRTRYAVWYHADRSKENIDLNFWPMDSPSTLSNSLVLSSPEALIFLSNFFPVHLCNSFLYKPTQRLSLLSLNLFDWPDDVYMYQWSRNWSSVYWNNPWYRGCPKNKLPLLRRMVNLCSSYDPSYHEYFL